jgi:hypothetical protein
MVFRLLIVRSAISPSWVCFSDAYDMPCIPDYY